MPDFRAEERAYFGEIGMCPAFTCSASRPLRGHHPWLAPELSELSMSRPVSGLRSAAEIRRHHTMGIIRRNSVMWRAIFHKAGMRVALPPTQ